MSTRLSTGLRELILTAIKTAFDGGVCKLYTGTPMAKADEAELGDLLVTITLDGGAHTPGVSTNGLVFGDITHDGNGTFSVLAKTDPAVWKGVAIRDGVIGWGRLYDVNVDTGASTSAVRMDGEALTVDGATFEVSTQTTKSGVEVVVTALNIQIPY